MKKVFLLIVALLVLGEGICFNSFEAQAGKTVREVRIEVLVIGGGKPRPRPRSLQPIVEAELDLMANQLFLEFNEAVGRVTISVKNSIGQVVSSYTCNTARESIAILGIADIPDSYTVSIIGDEIEARGYFDITAY